MKGGKLLLVFGVVILAGIFAASGLIYASNVQDPSTTAQGNASVGKEFPKDPADKGSPLHLWNTLIEKGLKAGSAFTTKDAQGWRNWSDSTVNDELNSLIDNGVIRRTSKGNYEVLVTATVEQTAEINEQVKPIVDLKGTKKESLGLDAYKTDAGKLGGEKVDAIKTVIAQVVGKSSRLNTEPQEKIITVTASTVLGMSNQNKTELINLVSANGYTLAIATENNDAEYTDKIVGSFAQPDAVKQLIAEGKVVFSLIKNTSLLSAIEDLVVKQTAERTLNNLTAEQQKDLKGGV